MSPRRLALTAVAALALTPALAAACAVCGGGPDRMRTAFLVSTIFLSLLPLALIFGGLFWLRRHAREALQGEFVDRDEVASRARGPEPAPSAETGAVLEGGESPARA